jgi:hypothetical protein
MPPETKPTDKKPADRSHAADVAKMIANGRNARAKLIKSGDETTAGWIFGVITSLEKISAGKDPSAE